MIVRRIRGAEFRESSTANLCCGDEARRPVIAENRRYHGEGIDAQSAQLTKIMRLSIRRPTPSGFVYGSSGTAATLFPLAIPIEHLLPCWPTRTMPQPFTLFGRGTRTRDSNKWASNLLLRAWYFYRIFKSSRSVNNSTMAMNKLPFLFSLFLYFQRSLKCSWEKETGTKEIHWKNVKFIIVMYTTQKTINDLINRIEINHPISSFYSAISQQTKNLFKKKKKRFTYRNNRRISICLEYLIGSVMQP